MRRSRIMLLALMLGSPAILAGTGEEEEVRVYTNDYLEARFGPPSAPDRATVDDDAWGFVADHLEREHGRIDADRSHDLADRRSRVEEAQVDRSRSRSGYGYPHLYGVRHGHGPKKSKRSRHRTVHRPEDRVLGGRIVPLHAGPSTAERMRAEAMQRSGADAFPSNSRRRP